ncbi:hypothetical protein C4577_04635 [Candidatus Parcubacteria bacterium]|nr:MAG: hypothetical protein C4577_04635 [Candidatus Parcubacteria bacterium]
MIEMVELADIIKIMEEDQKGVVTPESKEIVPSLGLVKQLLEEGKVRFGGLHNGSGGDYYNDIPNSRVTKLPAKFASLTLGDDPEKYFLVYYDDRRSSYFAEGTRGRRVCLSTQQRKGESNDRLREIIYREGEGSQAYNMTINESVKEADFRSMDGNSADVVSPYGDSTAVYELVSDHHKRLLEFKSSRLDEAMVSVNGASKTARWLRNLAIDAVNNIIRYSDCYMLDRANTIRNQRRVKMEFVVQGPIDNPSSIIVALGGYDSSPSLRPRILWEDKESGIKFAKYLPVDDDLELLKEDTNYSFIKEENRIDRAEMLEFFGRRVRLLRDQWDKPTSVFEPVPQIEGKPLQREESRR